MKMYSAHGVNEFIICCGYKGYLIKEYFANYFLHMSDVTFDLQANAMSVHQSVAEPWKVTLVDTGEGTGTGGRLKRVAAYVRDQDAFCMTYGDGVADVDIAALLRFHASHGKVVTVTAVQPPSRFGALALHDGAVTAFQEKPDGAGGPPPGLRNTWKISGETLTISLLFSMRSGTFCARGNCSCPHARERTSLAARARAFMGLCQTGREAVRWGRHLRNRIQLRAERS